MQDAFIFDRSLYDAIKKLDNDKDKLTMYESICDYAFYDNVPQMSGILSMAFELIKPIIDKGKKAAGTDNTYINDVETNTITKRFVPPSIEEVKAYIDENNYINVDAETFIKYYDARGWYAGKTKIKNWKAAVASWNSREKKTKKPFDYNQLDEYEQIDYAIQHNDIEKLNELRPHIEKECKITTTGWEHDAAEKELKKLYDYLDIKYSIDKNGNIQIWQ